MTSTTILRSRTPEDEEIDRKRQELADLEVVLAEREETLASLEYVISTTRLRYLRTVGVLLARLDEINASIAACMAALHPREASYARQAEQARSQADESAEATAGATALGDEQDKPAEPSQVLKTTYRKLAKEVHPDLAKDEIDRQRRTKIMAEVNAAYQSGDTDRLSAILDDWQQSADRVTGDDAGAELIRLIRKIAAVRRRIDELDTLIAQRQSDSSYKLHARIQQAMDLGHDLLAEMCEEIETEIARKEEYLAHLEQRLAQEHTR